MPFTGKVGDTLRLRDTGARHRYVILTSPNGDGDVIIANFTTAKHHEWFVSFKPRGNKDLFTQRCTVNYTNAGFYPLDALKRVAEHNLGEYVFCPLDITNKIITGAFQSRYIALEIVEELKSKHPQVAKNYYKNNPENDPKTLDNA